MNRMVSFIGAGPGAVDLITVRGQKLLSEADAYLYQSKKMGRNRTSAPPVTAISQPLASI